MGAVMHGDKLPHRSNTRHKTDVRSLRERVDLTQAAFARMIGVSVRTLQNWEQGRREPDGPAKALLKVVERQPKAVLAALHAA
jgi:putative transcriptional regulator